MKNLRITIEGKTYDVQVDIIGEESSPAVQPIISSASFRTAAPVAAPVAVPAPAAKKPSDAPAGDGDILSPLAAVVVSVDVYIGQEIKEGDKVATLEAMKMNTVVSASRGGTVSTISVKQGDAVDEGQILVTLA